MHRRIGLGLLVFAFATSGLVQAQADPPASRLYEMATDGSSVAFERLTAMAEAGDAEAQLNLGWLYHDGWVVPQNSSLAVQLFRRAADQSLADAQFWLGWMYDLGEGVPKDPASAVAWFRKAAEQGDRDAQYNLGLKYRDGSGAPKDLAAAYAWMTLAASQGERFAEKSRNDLEKSLTPSQIEEARKLAEEWKPKNNRHAPERD